VVWASAGAGGANPPDIASALQRFAATPNEGAEPRGSDTGTMLSNALRLILLRFLPRRVLPILTAIEIFRLIQRLRRRGPEPVSPRRLVTVNGPDRPAP